MVDSRSISYSYNFSILFCIGSNLCGQGNYVHGYTTMAFVHVLGSVSNANMLWLELEVVCKYGANEMDSYVNSFIHKCTVHHAAESC